MERILAQLELRTKELAGHPFFEFLRDASVAPERRFAFVRCVAPWVLGFSDLCSFVLREEPARDRFQEMVNVHAREDDGHWRWFLEDVATLGQDRELPFTDSLRFLWGPDTTSTRRLTYRLMNIASKASSLERVVLVEAIEDVNKVALAAARRAAEDFERQSGRRLAYFGAKHNAVEEEHSLDGDEARRALLAATPSESERAAMGALVDEVFAAFSESMSELHRFVKSAE